MPLQRAMAPLNRIKPTNSATMLGSKLHEYGYSSAT